MLLFYSIKHILIKFMVIIIYYGKYKILFIYKEIYIDTQRNIIINMSNDSIFTNLIFGILYVKYHCLLVYNKYHCLLFW